MKSDFKGDLRTRRYRDIRAKGHFRDAPERWRLATHLAGESPGLGGDGKLGSGQQAWQVSHLGPPSPSLQPRGCRAAARCCFQAEECVEFSFTPRCQSHMSLLEDTLIWNDVRGLRGPPPRQAHIRHTRKWAGGAPQAVMWKDRCFPVVQVV